MSNFWQGMVSEACHSFQYILFKYMLEEMISERLKEGSRRSDDSHEKDVYKTDHLYHAYQSCGVKCSSRSCLHYVC